MNTSFCKYIKAFPQNKDQIIQLTSSNSIVGDEFQIDINTKNKSCIIKNRFNHDVAKLDDDFFNQVNLVNIKHHTIKCFLGFVAYNAYEDDFYWASFLIYSYKPDDKDCFNVFNNYIQQRLREGNKPNIMLDKVEYQKVISTKGTWQPKNILKNKDIIENSVFIKNKMSFNEKITELAREKNKGCYFLTTLFFILILFVVVWLIFLQ